MKQSRLVRASGLPVRQCLNYDTGFEQLEWLKSLPKSMLLKCAQLTEFTELGSSLCLSMVRFIYVFTYVLYFNALFSSYMLLRQLVTNIIGFRGCDV